MDGFLRVSESDIVYFTEQLIKDERSENTIRKYVRDVRAFANFLGTGTLCKESLIRYKNELTKRYSPASVNSMLVAVNRFMTVLGHSEFTVRTLRVQRQRFRSKEKELTKEEYKRLLEVAQKKGRYWLVMIMQTLCSTGMRIGELPFITVEAVEQGSATVFLKGKLRQVLLPTDLCTELKEYARNKNIQKGSIFVTRTGKCLDRSNILHGMKKLCTEADVAASKVFPHNLRHLFACIYYQVSNDIGHLADILGHTSVDTTRIYTTVSFVSHRKMIDGLGLTVKIPQNHNYAVNIKHHRIRES